MGVSEVKRDERESPMGKLYKEPGIQNIIFCEALSRLNCMSLRKKVIKIYTQLVSEKLLNPNSNHLELIINFLLGKNGLQSNKISAGSDASILLIQLHKSAEIHHQTPQQWQIMMSQLPFLFEECHKNYKQIDQVSG